MFIAVLQRVWGFGGFLYVCGNFSYRLGWCPRLTIRKTVYRAKEIRQMCFISSVSLHYVLRVKISQHPCLCNSGGCVLSIYLFSTNFCNSLTFSLSIPL